MTAQMPFSIFFPEKTHTLMPLSEQQVWNECCALENLPLYVVHRFSLRSTCNHIELTYGEMERAVSSSHLGAALVLWYVFIVSVICSFFSDYYSY